MAPFFPQAGVVVSSQADLATLEDPVMRFGSSEIFVASFCLVSGWVFRKKMRIRLR
jgi:hypothetical protein